MDFKAKNEAYKTRVVNSFNSQKFMGFIGAKLKDVSPGYCEIHLDYHPDLTQQNGFFHAGIIGTLADNASGYAGYSLMAEGASVLTVEFKLNILSPGDGEQLIAKGHVLKNGRTLTVCRTDIYTLKGGIEKLCAASQSTLIELKDTADKK